MLNAILQLQAGAALVAIHGLLFKQLIVNGGGFRPGHLHIHAAKRLDDLSQAMNIDNYIVFDIHLKITVYGLHGQLRARGGAAALGAAKLVGGIDTLSALVAGNLHRGIARDGAKRDAARILVDGADNNGVAAPFHALRILIAAVDAKQQNVEHVVRQGLVWLQIAQVYLRLGFVLQHGGKLRHQRLFLGAELARVCRGGVGRLSLPVCPLLPLGKLLGRQVLGHALNQTQV